MRSPPDRAGSSPPWQGPWPSLTQWWAIPRRAREPVACDRCSRLAVAGGTRGLVPHDDAPAPGRQLVGPGHEPPRRGRVKPGRMRPPERRCDLLGLGPGGVGGGEGGGLAGIGEQGQASGVARGTTARREARRGCRSTPRQGRQGWPDRRSPSGAASVCQPSPSVPCGHRSPQPSPSPGRPPSRRLAQAESTTTAPRIPLGHLPIRPGATGHPPPLHPSTPPSEPRHSQIHRTYATCGIRPAPAATAGSSVQARCAGAGTSTGAAGRGRISTSARATAWRATTPRRGPSPPRSRRGGRGPRSAAPWRWPTASFGTGWRASTRPAVR